MFVWIRMPLHIVIQALVKLRNISFTNIDKEIIRSGEKSSEKQINFAQRLLKANFPKINHIKIQHTMPFKFFIMVEITGYVLLPFSHLAKKCLYMIQDIQNGMSTLSH